MTAPIVFQYSREERHILPDYDGPWIFNHSNADERRIWDKREPGQLWERISERGAR